MEKSIVVTARYHYKQGYFVEVSHEDSVIAGRDYWLCKKNSSRKMYMFSSSYTDDQTEEHMILNNISENIQKYENTMAAIKYA